MPSPHHESQAPFRLPSNIVYFHDWRYVNSSGPHWVPDEDGAEAALFMKVLPPRMRLEYRDLPLGIRLVAQRASKTEPVLDSDTDDQIILFGGSLIREQGRYRLWYDCWPEEDFGTERSGSFNIVRYAESDDGTAWRRPVVGSCRFRGTAQNNVVYGGSITTKTGYHGGCVFLDPSAPPRERYKAFHLGWAGGKELEGYLRERPDAVGPHKLGKRHVGAIYGAVSPDGLEWTQIPGPLLVQTSDTHNCCTYDPLIGKYVAYVRVRYFEKRSIGRCESSDFRRFPLPEPLFWPNAAMEPYDLWYAQSKTTMPGAPDYHVMFPMRWSLPWDRFELPLATSPDGIMWSLVPDPGGRISPVLSPGDPGAWDEGVVEPGIGLVELPGNRMGILYSGSPVPHKHPRKAPLCRIAWAWWPSGRLVALEAPVEGSFSLMPLVFEGRTARLNVRTRYTGYVETEALGPDGRVLPGRCFADCDRIGGDHLDRAVTWGGQADLGHPEGAPVTLRFRMRSAELFSVRFA